MPFESLQRVETSFFLAKNDPLACHIVRTGEQDRRFVLRRHFDAVCNHAVKVTRQTGNQAIPVILNETRLAMHFLSDGIDEIVFEPGHPGFMLGIMKHVRHIGLTIRGPGQIGVIPSPRHDQSVWRGCDSLVSCYGMNGGCQHESQRQ